MAMHLGPKGGRIWAPVGEFWGSVFGGDPYSSFYRCSSTQHTALPCSPSCHALHAREELQGFILGTGDVAVLVQAEGLWHGVERQAWMRSGHAVTRQDVTWDGTAQLSCPVSVAALVPCHKEWSNTSD